MRRFARALLVSLLLLAGAASFQAAEPKFQDIKVRPGDTLWSIANKYLKDPQRWSVILKHNQMPTKELTVPLPGMTLRVPIVEIKESLRAAKLVLARNRVLLRKEDSPSWNKTDKGRELFNGDGLRTLAKSWARVEFFSGAPLSLEPNSMAILKSPKKADHDLELKRGTIHTTQARVVTPSARILPKGKGTKYTAKVLDDLSTRVQVLKGAADVQDVKGIKTVEVKAGFYTDVSLDRLPNVPVKIPKAQLASANMADGLSANAGGAAGVPVRTGGLQATAGLRALAMDIQNLSVGIPVAAYQVQISKSRTFRKVVYEERFDAYDQIDLSRSGLPKGQYWVRVAVVDLLGDVGKYAVPRKWSSGQSDQFQSLAFQGAVEITRPAQEEVKVRVPRYRIMGQAQADLTVRINGDRVRMDEDGNFSYEVSLKRGVNGFRIEASDLRGNETTVIRRIIREER